MGLGAKRSQTDDEQSGRGQSDQTQRGRGKRGTKRAAKGGRGESKEKNKKKQAKKRKGGGILETLSNVQRKVMMVTSGWPGSGYCPQEGLQL